MIKGMYKVDGIACLVPGELTVYGHYVGLDPDIRVNQTPFQRRFATDAEDAANRIPSLNDFVQDALTEEHGYTFAEGDSVAPFKQE